MKTLTVERPGHGKISATAEAPKCSGCSTAADVVAFQVRGPIYGVRIDLCPACLRTMGELAGKCRRKGGRDG